MKLSNTVLFRIGIVLCICMLLLSAAGLYLAYRSATPAHSYIATYIGDIFLLIIALALVILVLGFFIAVSANLRQFLSFSKNGVSNIALFSKDLGALFSHFNIKKSALISILNEMKEEVLVISDTNSIIYYNASFANRFITSKNQAEKDYRAALPYEHFIHLVYNIYHSNKPHVQKEISINNISYLLSVSIVGSKKVIIIVFHDISENKAFEKIKKDFIVNASHELRTPLTSIKGFLELAESNPQNFKNYLAIVSRNTDRMIHMVNDLLKLSKLEADNTQISYEPFNFVELIKGIVVLFQNRLSDKGLSLHFVFHAPTIIIEADKLKLEEVFINLIDNAIKYSEEGAITIYTTKRQEMLEIQIVDTGIGIPKKYLERIFERFFVVDKARSRQTGGTGLGLAIVKHIVQLHGGSIDIQSTQNVGTVCSITVPFTAPVNGASPAPEARTPKVLLGIA